MKKNSPFFSVTKSFFCLTRCKMRTTKILLTNNLLGLRIVCLIFKRIRRDIPDVKKNIPENNLGNGSNSKHVPQCRKHLKTLGYIFDACIFAFYVFTRFLFAPSHTLIIAMSATLAQTGAPDLCAAQRSTRRRMKNLRAHICLGTKKYPNLA